MRAPGRSGSTRQAPATARRCPATATPGPIDGPGASRRPVSDGRRQLRHDERREQSRAFRLSSWWCWIERSRSNPIRWNTLLVGGRGDRSRQTGSSVDWGLYAFPTERRSLQHRRSSATAIDVMPTPDDATHVVAHLAAASTFTGGTPTAAAIDVAAAYMFSRTTVNPKFLMLVTDGAPTCARQDGLADLRSGPGARQTPSRRSPRRRQRACRPSSWHRRRPSPRTSAR